MANIKSEQLRSDLSLELEFDQVLSKSEINEKLINILGKENCSIEEVLNKKVFVYHHDNKKEYLLLAAVSYLGGNGQHPTFKKRMQLKTWYKDIVNFFNDKDDCNVRFVGVYHYEGNIVLSEFLKNTYINRKMNSSAAHVYTNDLYQAMKKNVFQRMDKRKNQVISIKYDKFKDYLDGKLDTEGSIFDLFMKFNKEFEFGNWITAKDAITEMYDNKWPKWKETEWAGWYLEYKFSNFIKEYELAEKIKYVGNSNKKIGKLDFDLWFDKEGFYGDLKASDALSNETPGNDKESFIKCINKYDKFWYIVYEHETIKDSQNDDYEATRWRTNFIKDNNEWDKRKKWNELSYFKRMKHSVRFTKMSIIELNRINFNEILKDFNQGRQPNGDLRKPKFKISKKNIDNFVVFQYEFTEIE